MKVVNGGDVYEISSKVADENKCVESVQRESKSSGIESTEKVGENSCAVRTSKRKRSKSIKFRGMNSGTAEENRARKE